MDAAAPAERAAGTPASRRPVHLERRRAWGVRLVAAGVAAMVASMLVFALSPGWSMLLFLAAIPLAGFGWLMLAVLGWRYALAATAALGLCYLVLSVGTPALNRVSWGMLVWWHRDHLERAVALLGPVRMTEEIFGPEPLCSRLPGLPPGDCAALQEAMGEFGANQAWKEGAVTLFVTHRWINLRGGVLHCPRDCPRTTDDRFVVHVAGDWYRWGE
jgi:hypothetical protein